MRLLPVGPDHVGGIAPRGTQTIRHHPGRDGVPCRQSRGGRSDLRAHAQIGHAYAGGRAPEIRRAMRNLEAALTIRLGHGPLTADQVRAVTAVLDRAASEIEQS